jgi:adenosylhomocysteine nucleosidase
MKNQTQNRIAIVAALPGELKPLVHGWRQTGKHAWTGTLGEHPCMAVAGGIGAAAAARALAQVEADFQPNVLVSYGWAGALTCALKPGMATAINEIVDAATGERFATDHAEGTRLLTLDHVARANEKRKLAETWQTVLVDMEAAAVARFAASRQISFYCFKGVSDGHNDVLPDFSRFISTAGQLRMPAFLSHVALHPQYWKSLGRLGKSSQAAASSLATLAQQSLRRQL